MTKVATRTAAKLPSSRKFPTIGAAWVVLGTILEQAGQQGLPEIQAFATPARKNLKKSSRALKTICIRQGPRKKTKGPRRDPQNMQPGCRKSHAFGYRDSSVFIKNRWEFQSGSCFSQNSTKLADQTRVAGTWSSDRNRVAGTRSRFTRNPGENVVRIY